MSVATVLESVGNDLRGFYSKLASDVTTARQAWLIISSAQTRAVLLNLGSDAIKAVRDGGAACAAKGLSLALDEAVLQDIEQIVKDAEAGDGVLRADLKALGIVL
jgi:hypothetical protein